MNRSGENPKAEIPLAEFEKGAGGKVEFEIPFEVNTVVKSANLGEPIDVAKSQVGKVMHDIAQTYVGIEGGQAPAKKGLFSSLSLKK